MPGCISRPEWYPRWQVAGAAAARTGTGTEMEADEHRLRGTLPQ